MNLNLDKEPGLFCLFLLFSVEKRQYFFPVIHPGVFCNVHIITRGEENWFSLEKVNIFKVVVDHLVCPDNRFVSTQHDVFPADLGQVLFDPIMLF